MRHGGLRADMIAEMNNPEHSVDTAIQNAAMEVVRRNQNIQEDFQRQKNKLGRQMTQLVRLTNQLEGIQAADRHLVNQPQNRGLMEIFIPET